MTGGSVVMMRTSPGRSRGGRTMMMRGVDRPAGLLAMMMSPRRRTTTATRPADWRGAAERLPSISRPSVFPRTLPPCPTNTFPLCPTPAFLLFPTLLSTVRI